MAYRDVLFAPLVSVFVLTGLPESTTAALPAALEQVVHKRHAARRRWPGSVLRHERVAEERIADLVEASVRRVPEPSTDAELVAVAHAHGLAGLPVALVLTPTRCAVVTAHAVFDGTGSLALIHDLLDAAAGVELVPEDAKSRLPLFCALRHVRRADVRDWVDARRHRPLVVASAPPPPSGGAASSAAYALGAGDLAAIRRYREPDRVGRATLLSRLASLIVAALREVETSDADIPVWMTADLRHLVDGPVDGNFIGRELIGTLHGDQWAPGALAARLVRMKGPGQALSLVWSPTGWLLRSALGRKPVAGEEIVLTLATTQRAFPVPVATVIGTSVGGSPTFAFVWQSRGAVHVSVYSSSGRFDLDRFEAAFRDLVRQREKR